MSMRKNGRAWRWLGAVAAPLVLAGGLAGIAPAAATAADPAAGCHSVTGAQPPAPDSVRGSGLSSVTVLSACNAWAVGSSIAPVTIEPHGLIEHWDGAGWTQMPSPEPANVDGTELLSVRAVSPTDLWAVGQSEVGNTSHLLILHGDGRTWTVSTPDLQLGDTFSTLNGVRAVSARDVWAVGEFRSGGSSDQTLILHWNGTSWTKLPSPNPGGTRNNNDLNGVAATASNDAWAAGEFANGSGHPLLLHWDGKKWTAATSPSFRDGDDLKAVGASSRSNVWAVGESFAGDGSRPVTLHWNGTRWSRVATPNLPSGFPPNNLFGVAVASASSAWAVGTYRSDAAALILHWNGARWSRAGGPLDPAQFSSRLFGVALGPAGSAWAVGDDRSLSDSIVTVPLALHCC
jgi:hypothetical protein